MRVSARARSWLVLGAAATALALGALAAARHAAELRSVRRALPALDGRLAVSGLDAQLVIVRDARGIPHVRAASERDAYFGLGFAQAQDRLAQMVWLARAARGRVAEVVGAEGLATDRWSRTLGFGRLADARASHLDAAARRLLDAYAAGVNAWIEEIRQGRAAAPVPLARLHVSLEPWRPADSIAIEKLLAWALDGSIDATLTLSDLIERLGGFGARPFFPPGATGDLVPPPRLETRAAPAPPGPMTPRRPEEPAAPAALVALRRAVGLAGSSIGSSAWVVGGGLTANGLPLLAGDLHLEPTLPAGLHEAHLSAPGFELAGAGPPGVPIFWSAHNGRVAWSATHARAVVVDLYLETLDPDDPDRYRSGAGWRALVRRLERIAVQGGPEEELEVRETSHGPLVESLLGGGRPPLAAAWSGAEPGDGIGSLLRAARARDAGEFRAALAEHQEPALEFVYADVRGEGGRQLAGWVPKRAMSTGLVPIPGRSAWYDWRGPVPFESLPHTALGAGGWLVAADNRLAERGEVPGVEWWWRPGERAARIDALLRQATGRGKVDAGDLAALQTDLVSGAARERVRLVLEMAGEPTALPPEARHAAQLLTGWDGATRADSVGAAAWHALLGAVLQGLLERPLGTELLARYLSLRGVRSETLLDALLAIALAEQPEPDAIVDRAALRAAARDALRQTGLSLRVRLGPNPEKWLWGRLHPLRFRAFGWPEAAWGGAGDELERPFGGDGVTIAVGEYDAADPYDVRVISAYRLVVDLASPALALSALAPGESEHPEDPRRTAGIERWLAGKPALLATHPFLVEEGAQARLVLERKPGR